MAVGLLQRKPDSGLGNIRTSASAPTRHIDWVLMTAQCALAVIGLFVIYSASYTKFANPYLFVTRQEIFLIGAVSEGARLSVDIGPLKLQPAELAKVTTLLALAAYLGDDERVGSDEGG